MDAIILFFIFAYMMHDMPAISVYYPSIAYAAITIITVLLLLSRIRLKSITLIIPFVLLPILNLVFTDGALSSYTGWAVALQFFVYPLIALYVLQNGDKHIAKVVFWTYLAFQIIICITTIIALNIYPEASRAFAHGDFAQSDEYVLYRSLNIGGFTFIYALTLSIPLIVLVWRFGKRLFSYNGAIRLFAFSFLILSLYTIFRAQYTTAIVFAAFALGLSFIKKKLKFGVLLLVFIAGFVLFLVLKPTIATAIHTVAEHSEGLVFQDRIEDIALSMQGKSLDESSDFAARQFFWAKSIDTFISNPLGTWTNNEVGGHSTWLDAFARYGIFAFLLIALIVRSVKQFLLRNINNTTIYNHLVVCVLTVILLGFFNPTYNTDFLLFVIPVYLYVVADINIVSYYRN